MVFFWYFVRFIVDVFGWIVFDDCVLFVVFVVFVGLV